MHPALCNVITILGVLIPLEERSEAPVQRLRMSSYVGLLVPIILACTWYCSNLLNGCTTMRSLIDTVGPTCTQPMSWHLLTYARPVSSSSSILNQQPLFLRAFQNRTYHRARVFRTTRLLPNIPKTLSIATNQFSRSKTLNNSGNLPQNATRCHPSPIYLMHIT